MSARAHLSHRALDRLCYPIPGPFAPVVSHDEVGMAGLVEQVLGLAIGPRCVVRVRTLHGHPVRLSLGGHGQLFAPTAVIMVAELGPVQRAQDDGRLVAAGQHDAKGRQWVGDALGGWVPARPKRVAERWCNVTMKCADVDYFCRSANSFDNVNPTPIVPRCLSRVALARPRDHREGCGAYRRRAILPSQSLSAACRRSTSAYPYRTELDPRRLR